MYVSVRALRYQRNKTENETLCALPQSFTTRSQLECCYLRQRSVTHPLHHVRRMDVEEQPPLRGADDQALKGGARNRTVTAQQRLRERWDVPPHVEIGIVKTCPMDYKRVNLTEMQRNFLQCAADTGVGYFLEGTRDMACMNPQRCAVNAVGPPRDPAVSRRQSIALLNSLLPKYNAAAVWARRNWIVQHACVPCITKENAILYLNPPTERKTTSAAFYRKTYPYVLSKVKLKSGRVMNNMVALVDAQGYLDWKILQQWDADFLDVDVKWVYVYQRMDRRGSLSQDVLLKYNARALMNDTVNYMLDEPAMWYMMGKRTNEAWGTLGRVLEAHPGVEFQAHLDETGTDVANLTTTSYKDNFAAFRAGVLAEEIKGVTNGTKKYDQGNAESHWDNLMYKQLVEANDACSRTSIQTMFWNNPNNKVESKEITIKQLNSTSPPKYDQDGDSKSHFNDIAIQPLVAIKNLKTKHTSQDTFHECRFRPEWRIESRDIDLRYGVVTGMEVLAVDAVLDESRYAVYPTALFAWDARLEELANKVQVKVKRRAAQAYVERLTDILYVNREFRALLRDNDVKHGGLKDLVDDPMDLGSIGDLANIAVNVMLRCQELQAQEPSKTENDWKADSTEFKMDGTKNLKKLKVNQVCQPMTLSNSEVKLIPKFEYVYGFQERKAGTSSDPVPSRFEENPQSQEAKLFRDIAKFHRAETAKTQERRAHLLGETGR